MARGKSIQIKYAASSPFSRSHGLVQHGQPPPEIVEHVLYFWRWYVESILNCSANFLFCMGQKRTRSQVHLNAWPSARLYSFTMRLPNTVKCSAPSSLRTIENKGRHHVSSSTVIVQTLVLFATEHCIWHLPISLLLLCRARAEVMMPSDLRPAADIPLQRGCWGLTLAYFFLADG